MQPNLISGFDFVPHMFVRRNENIGQVKYLIPFKNYRFVIATFDYRFVFVFMPWYYCSKIFCFCFSVSVCKFVYYFFIHDK